MGVWTLANFRSELQSLTGGQITDSTRQTLYINTGLNLLVGMVEFASCKASDTFPTVAGTKIYAGPTNALGIRQIIDVTSKKRLIYTSPDRWTQYVTADQVQGRPKRWTLGASGVELWPVPDAVYTLGRAFLQRPTQLSAAGDVTQFAAHWDLPILLLSAHALLGVLDEEARSVSFFNRASALIQSLMTDTDFTLPAETDGFWVALSEEDLVNARAPQA